MNIPLAPAPLSAAGAAPTVTITNKDLVEKYRLLRDKKEEIVKRHKAELAPLNDAMDKIENVLLDVLNRTGSESTRTEAGTFFKVTRTSYSINDPAAFRAYVEAHNLPDLYENRVSKSALEELISRGETLPPGLKVSSEVSVNIRK